MASEVDLRRLPTLQTHLLTDLLTYFFVISCGLSTSNKDYDDDGKVTNNPYPGSDHH